MDLDGIAERVGGSIPEEDYERFVKAYESAKILEDIRKKLGKRQ